MDIIDDLASDMLTDPNIEKLCFDKDIAIQFYQALCNVEWYRIIDTEDQVIDKLRGEKPGIWSCSWRYAAGLIADIRNKQYNIRRGEIEDYLDFYCHGTEGVVTPIVLQSLKNIGWNYLNVEFGKLCE